MCVCALVCVCVCVCVFLSVRVSAYICGGFRLGLACGKGKVSVLVSVKAMQGGKHTHTVQHLKAESL